MPKLLRPIFEDRAAFVIGARKADNAREALLPQARFGNWLACLLIHRFFGVRYTDLGPFRAIRYPQLLALNMQDKTFGWTVEMQLKPRNSQSLCARSPSVTENASAPPKSPAPSPAPSKQATKYSQPSFIIVSWHNTYKSSCS